MCAPAFAQVAQSSSPTTPSWDWSPRGWRHNHVKRPTRRVAGLPQELPPSPRPAMRLLIWLGRHRRGRRLSSLLRDWSADWTGVSCSKPRARARPASVSWSWVCCMEGRAAARNCLATRLGRLRRWGGLLEESSCGGRGEGCGSRRAGRFSGADKRITDTATDECSQDTPPPMSRYSCTIAALLVIRFTATSIPAQSVILGLGRAEDGDTLMVG